MIEQTARELIVRAGHELLEAGLIVRTWGNISCRIDDSTFAVTPSGRSYETMRTEEIVTCRIEDCAYSGDMKPSSEKRIHALIYKSCPDANVVIHTHQVWASCVSAAQLYDMPSTNTPLVGNSVPIASYGLPGTKKLMKGVGAALAHCRGRAIIMSHHGAVCFGKNYEEAFSAAKQLETACFEFIRGKYLKRSGQSSGDVKDMADFYAAMDCPTGTQTQQMPVFLGSSLRTADGFVLKNDRDMVFRFGDKMTSKPALIHKAIYERYPDVRFINQSMDAGLLAVSDTGRTLRPWLDDFAQLVGPSAKCAADAGPEPIVSALRGRQGVLVPGGGALCCAASEDDARAVELVMIKNALAQLSVKFLESGRTIPLPDCLLMRFVYKKSYSKKAKVS